MVSYVINGGPRPVAAATRERVEQAIAELDYRPNLVARALRSTRSNVIGLVVPDSSEAFFTELIHAVERAAFDTGSLVLLGNSGFSNAQEHQYAETLTNMQVDGLLLVRAEVAGRASAMISGPQHVPVVYLHHQAPGGSEAPSVVLANRAGGRDAARHLLAHGYQSIGCVTGTARSGPVADRARGCADALRAAGVTEQVILRTGLDRTSSRADVREWLGQSSRPRAIVATADGLAMDVINAAAELGLRVPQDLAVVGFGGTRAAEHSWPPLTTIAPSFSDMGSAAVSTLRQVREGAVSVQDRVLGVHLIARETCGCKAGS